MQQTTPVLSARLVHVRGRAARLTSTEQMRHLMAASDLMMLSSCRSLHHDKVLHKGSGMLNRSSGLTCTLAHTCAQRD